MPKQSNPQKDMQKFQFLDKTNSLTSCFMQPKNTISKETKHNTNMAVMKTKNTD